MACEADHTYTGLAALWRIALGALPSAVALGLALATVALWQQQQPASLPIVSGQMEREIIRTQIARADTLPDSVDILIVGDSSGLMGIDPLALGAGLGGARVESVATLGFVGPRGYAALLERMLRRGVRPARVLITLHPASLDRRETWAHYARFAEKGIREAAPPSEMFAGVRARLLAIADPILFLPMPGPLGDFYGSTAALGTFMRTHHGSAIDSSGPLREPMFPGPQLVIINDLFRAALPRLAKATAAMGAHRFRVVLMPQPDWALSGAVLASRAAACDEIEHALGLDPDRRLGPLPDELPGSLLASNTHPNPAGRQYYTRLLAEVMSRDRARWPWPATR